MRPKIARTAFFAFAAITTALTACGDPYQPVLLPVPSEPEDARLYDFSSGTLQDPSAFDAIDRSVVRVDQSPGWDLLFVVDPGIGPAFRPRGGFLEEDSESGIQGVDEAFDRLRSAPESGYVTSGLVPVAAGQVFALRSRRDPGYGNVRCRYYGKMQIDAIDASAGTLDLSFIVNPNCEKRQLVPENN